MPSGQCTPTGTQGESSMNPVPSGHVDGTGGAVESHHCQRGQDGAPLSNRYLQSSHKNETAN